MTREQQIGPWADDAERARTVLDQEDAQSTTDVSSTKESEDMTEEFKISGPRRGRTPQVVIEEAHTVEPRPEAERLIDELRRAGRLPVQRPEQAEAAFGPTPPLTADDFRLGSLDQ